MRAAAGAPVDVRVRRATLDGRDDGRGRGVATPAAAFRADRLARIWEPYVTSKPGGTGLGLAIARQTVLAHDGAVDGGERRRRGNEIRFVLPVDGSRNGEETMAC